MGNTGKYPAVTEPEHPLSWALIAKILGGLILAIVAFIVTGVFYPKITALEAQSNEQRIKWERTDERLKSIDSTLERIEKKLDK